MIKYCKEIKDNKLTKEEELSLGCKSLKGDIKAQHELILNNIKIVPFIASEFYYHDKDELISVGFVELVKSASKYDPKFGVKFSSYASLAIKVAMYNASNENKSIIHVPTSARRKYNKLKKLLECGYTKAEILKEMGINEFQFIEIFNYKLNFSQENIYSVFNGNDDDRGKEEINIPEYVEEDKYDVDKYDLIRKYMKLLSGRDKEIIERMFGIGKFIEPQSLGKIAIQLNISKERVRQIKEKAMYFIRKQLKSNHKIT